VLILEWLEIRYVCLFCRNALLEYNFEAYIKQIIYRASLNDVPDLEHMLLMFNEIQMHKIGTDGKRNFPSLCLAAAY
jgi:hypothetical protein